MEGELAFAIPKPLARPVLIGRQRERVLLHEELAWAIAGHGRLVLIGGEAGIGKTSLVQDVVQEARALGAHVLAGNCHDLTASPPYGLWLDLGSGYLSGPDLPAFPTALAGGRLTGIESQSALFAETLTFLGECCRRKPVVIVLEDLHWSDSASLDLLRFLAGHVAGLPVLFLATYRVDELTRRQPLYSQLPGLLRTGLSTRLDLKRLDRASVLDLIQAVCRLDVADEQRLLDYLERHAEGNPLYATELIRALEDEEILVSFGEHWRLAPLDRIVLPTLLTQVIDARIDRLGDQMRTMLSIASVIGEEFPLDLWAELAELDYVSLLTSVEQATDAHVLKADRNGTRVRFAHALTRDALYESISPPRRLLWHRAVADALMRHPNPDPDKIAHHLWRAGDERAPEWLITAGNRAQRAYTWLIAAERFIAAVSSLERVIGSQRERGWLLFRAARLMRLADPVRGLHLLGEARRLGEEAADPVLAGDARYSAGLLRVYSEDFSGVSEIRAGIEELEALDPEIHTGDATVAIALADSLPKNEGKMEVDLRSSIELQRQSGLHHRRGSLPWWYSGQGRVAEAIEAGDAFIAAVERLPQPGGLVQSSVAHAFHGMGFGYAAQCRPNDARTAFARSRAIYRTIDHHGVIGLAYLAELRNVVLPFETDNLHRRNHVCARAVSALGQAGGAMPPGFSARIAELSCLVIEGAWDQAERIIGDVPFIGNAYFAREVREAAVYMALHRGDGSAAWEHVSSFLPDGVNQLPGSRMFYEALFFQRLAAELACNEGEIEHAREWLEAHDRWLGWSGASLGIAEGELAWARFHCVTGSWRIAKERATAALRLATDPRQPLVLLGANRVLGELATVERCFPAAWKHLNAALNLADRCQARLERALTLAACAELAIVEDNVTDAKIWKDELSAIAGELRTAPLVSRLARIETAQPQAKERSAPFDLTTREIEVLQLVAEGLTDAAVASRLFISPRTVGQHLRSVYAKLDVSSRSAATRIAIEHGLA